MKSTGTRAPPKTRRPLLLGDRVLRFADQLDVPRTPHDRGAPGDRA